MNAFKIIAVSITLAAGSFWMNSALADKHAQKPAFISAKASQIKWKDAPSVAPGAKIAVLEGDLKAAVPITFRLRVPANTKVGVHTHPTFERVTIISGSLFFAIGEKFDNAKFEEYKPGDAFMVPPGMPMYAFTKKETVVQIHGTGPWGIDYLDPADAPKKK